MLRQMMSGGRKAQLGTWFDYVFAVVIGLVIFVVFFALINNDTKIIEKDIKQNTQNTKADVVLVSCLNMPVFNLTSTKTANFTPLDRSMTEGNSNVKMADLLNFIELENNESKKQLYMGVFKERMGFALDNIYGSRKWELAVKSKDIELDFGTVSGETHTSGAMLPSAKGGLIGVYLLTEGKKGIFDEIIGK